ncbi:iron-containing alcohol dehydrogenase [Streptomyces misionensis]|uniref:iron-containing alcohol dehydrogenase n=1 Tax=Streptomyces misionensis TaxID=67331 RepID=UPI0034260A7E
MSSPVSCRLAIDADAEDGIFTVTAQRSDPYRIHVSEGLTTNALTGHLRFLAGHLATSQIVMVIGASAAAHHLDVITAAVACTGLPLHVLPVEAGIRESGTAPGSLNSLTGVLHQHRAAQRVLVLGVGGGAVCNLVKTASGLQGMPYALVPTSVQAQLDAGIGYDAANNLPSAHHPAGVYIDPALTSTLPDRHIRAGLAAAVKVALIINPPLFDTLERTAPRPPAGPALTAIIREALGSKLLLLALHPERQLLDLGDRIASPYRAATGYRIPQGEAVAAGIAVAAAAAFLSGKNRLKERDRILNLLTAYRLPLTIPDQLREPVWKHMAAMGRSPGLVLPHRPGHCTLTDDDFDRTAFDKALGDLAARP